MRNLGNISVIAMTAVSVLFFHCSGAGIAGSSGKKVVTVNTFEDRSPEAGKYRAFKNGISSQIMEAMLSIPQLKVIDRETTIRILLDNKQLEFLGLLEEGTGGTDIQVELGHAVKAKYVVSGYFMVFQRKLQICARALEVDTQQVINQYTVTGSVDDFLQLQRELAIKLSQGLNIILNPDMEKLIKEKTETNNLNAYLCNYEGEKNLENIQIRTRLDKAKEINRINRLMAEEKKAGEEEIRRYKERSEKERNGLLGELASLDDQERAARQSDRADELKRILERKKKTAITLRAGEQTYWDELKRLEEQGRRSRERRQLELAHLERMTFDGKDISRERDEAKMKFEKALELDKDYERAKKNLLKLVHGLPFTL